MTRHLDPNELIPKSFKAGDPLGATDATPFVLTMEDRRGHEYIVRFNVRNVNLDRVDRGLKCLIPVRRIPK